MFKYCDLCSRYNMTKWKRPSSVNIPTVWSKFEGKKEIDGKRRKYWIQDITDDYLDEILTYMSEEFTSEEPLAKYSKPFHIPEGTHHFKDILNETLKNNLGLVCLTKDENDKPTIAAMNCTTLTNLCDEKSPEKDDIDVPIISTFKFMRAQVDPFKKFNITEYLDAMGLYVPAKYRGDGLGLELLKAREALCRAVGLNATLTMFTSKISQKLAERVGFKDIYSIDYDELERRDPKSKYPGIQDHTKTLRWMYLLYE